MDFRVELYVYRLGAEDTFRVRFAVSKFTGAGVQTYIVWPEDPFQEEQAAKERGKELVETHMRDKHGLGPDAYTLGVVG
ncbi:MAG: hypothetical protein QGI83_07935 [Candidatus Latescibacteria bacterium]|jgi:hypothetical protein|nr:hypothetical protein [Candidatus Latescibacterota bacterium]